MQSLDVCTRIEDVYKGNGMQMHLKYFCIREHFIFCTKNKIKSMRVIQRALFSIDKFCLFMINNYTLNFLFNDFFSVFLSFSISYRIHLNYIFTKQTNILCELHLNVVFYLNAPKISSHQQTTSILYMCANC